jgi:hypothetical protein
MEVHAYQPAATDTFPTIPTSYLEEHYTTHVFRNVDNTPGNDLIISAHPNGIAFITLASTHAAFTATSPSLPLDPEPLLPDTNQEIDASLDFDVGYQAQPQQSGQQASGSSSSGNNLLHAKFVKGRGPLITPDQPLCRLKIIKETSSEAAAPPASTGKKTDQNFLVALPLVKGGLVEMNQRIVDLKGKALLNVLRDEYIAILELKPSELQKLREAPAEEK